jgi:mono/diheme cytochrome c family protein
VRPTQLCTATGRRARRIASCAGALVIAGTLAGDAGQVRSVTDGVYSASQAARGQQIYQNRCVECHGKSMEGTVGPPMAGESFLASWSARPLASLVDRIQKTMPFNQPGTLSRQESTDLTAYMLQVGRFAAGTTDLSEAALSQIAFPASRAPSAVAATTPAGVSLQPPEGNLAELMRAIAFPSANIIFNLQIKNPATQPRKELGASPFDYVEWGATVYPGWLAVDQAAVALVETAPLLLTPGRRCQSGTPAPVERADWKQYVAALVDAGKLAYRTSRARDFEAFGGVSEKLNEACDNCHKVYRDKGGAEGSGAARCQ